MANFVALRHPVTILVIGFTNPGNLNNDLLIINPLKDDCETLLLRRALKQSD